MQNGTTSTERSLATAHQGHSNPLQRSCLENPMERRAWWAIVHGVAKSWTQLKKLITYYVLNFQTARLLRS